MKANQLKRIKRLLRMRRLRSRIHGRRAKAYLRNPRRRGNPNMTKNAMNGRFKDLMDDMERLQEANRKVNRLMAIHWVAMLIAIAFIWVDVDDYIGIMLPVWTIQWMCIGWSSRIFKAARDA